MALRADLGLQALLHSRLSQILKDTCRALSTEAKKQPTLAYEEIYADAAGHVRDRTAEASTSCSSSSSSDGPLTAILLHGLLGSSRNWRTYTKNLVLAAAKEHGRDVKALLVDLRNHGASSKLHGLAPPHNLEAAAGDVLQLVRQRLGGNTPQVLVGHSLGGKVVLEVLQQLANMHKQQGAEDRAETGANTSSSNTQQLQLPQQVWVLDSQPGVVTPDIDAPTSVARILTMINEIPVPLRNRQQLYDYLDKKGISQHVALWLGSNLVADNGDTSRLVWTFNVQGASAMYNSYRQSDHWNLLAQPPPGVTAHLVHGERSDRWTPGMLQQLQQAKQRWQQAAARGDAVGQLDVQMLPNAGHWVQSDNPQGLMSMMLPWFKDLQNKDS